MKYLTCLVTNDDRHAYDVIGVYKIHHGAGRFSYLTELAIQWLASTVMGEVGPITGGMPPDQEAKTVGQTKYGIDE